MRYSILLLLTTGVFLFIMGRNYTGTSKKAPGSKKPYFFCSPSFDASLSTQDNSPVLPGLGNLTYPVTTTSDSARLFFNQGLRLMYGFNHGESARSFRTAIRHDSTCALAYWGLAMVLGPNYNAPLNPSSLEEINAVIDKAVLHSHLASNEEKALITAISKRFPKEQEEDPTPYYEQYAELMKKASEKYPGNIDIATIYADALMNLHPWDLYFKDGKAKPWTPEIMRVLETTLAKDPDHPGTIHYYIHASEASAEPHLALKYADELRDAMPSAGHLVHMPSHTYIRTGDYHKGVLVNENASFADSTYIAQCRAQGFYPMYLYPHNLHFLSACAYLEGNAKKSLDAAWTVSRKVDQKYLYEDATLQHFYSIPLYILVQFGKWEEILKQPKPAEIMKYPVAIWHYARGMALINQQKAAAANIELNALKTLASDSTLNNMVIFDINSALELVKIAALTLEAELLANIGSYDQAIPFLYKAVEIEDALNYTEPPDWFFSIRHTLGHWLNKAQRYEEAEKVYLEDLKTFPENGWALMGLYNSLKGQDKESEAKLAMHRYKKAFKYSDVKIVSSRYF